MFQDDTLHKLTYFGFCFVYFCGRAGKGRNNKTEGRKFNKHALRSYVTNNANTHTDEQHSVPVNGQLINSITQHKIPL